MSFLIKYLVTSSQTENQMKSGFLLNVVIAQSTTIFQLLTSENQTLLIRGNSFLVLDLLLDVLCEWAKKEEKIMSEGQQKIKKNNQKA